MLIPIKYMREDGKYFKDRWFSIESSIDDLYVELDNAKEIYNSFAKIKKYYKCITKASYLIIENVREPWRRDIKIKTDILTMVYLSSPEYCCLASIIVC